LGDGTSDRKSPVQIKKMEKNEFDGRPRALSTEPWPFVALRARSSISDRSDCQGTFARRMHIDPRGMTHDIPDTVNGVTYFAVTKLRITN